MNKNNKSSCYGLLLLSVGLLEGCMPAYKTVQKDFIDYGEASLEQGVKPAVLPDDKEIRVAVTEFALPNDTAGPDYEAARLANLNQYASEVVNDAIVKAGGALVSKEDAAKIKTYIQEAEKRGSADAAPRCEPASTRSKKKRSRRSADTCSKPAASEPYAGLSDVNYAMLGEISSVTYGAETTSLPVNGSTSYFCRYSAAVSGTLAVYKIPQTVREKSIRFQAEDSDSASGPCPSGSLSPQIIKTALEKSINAVKSEFQNLLAVDAYVVNKRVFQKKKGSIFQITAGQNLNLRPGMKVRFLHIDKRIDAVTGKPADEETMVGSGVVSDKIDPTRAWVFVDVEDDKGIRMWDVGRPFHEDCKILCKWQEQ